MHLSDILDVVVVAGLHVEESNAAVVAGDNESARHSTGMALLLLTDALKRCAMEGVQEEAPKIKKTPLSIVHRSN